jgi:hypothetical protein
MVDSGTTALSRMARSSEASSGGGNGNPASAVGLDWNWDRCEGSIDGKAGKYASASASAGANASASAAYVNVTAGLVFCRHYCERRSELQIADCRK